MNSHCFVHLTTFTFHNREASSDGLGMIHFDSSYLQISVTGTKNLCARVYVSVFVWSHSFQIRMTICWPLTKVFILFGTNPV